MQCVLATIQTTRSGMICVTSMDFMWWQKPTKRVMASSMETILQQNNPCLLSRYWNAISITWRCTTTIRASLCGLWETKPLMDLTSRQRSTGLRVWINRVPFIGNVQKRVPTPKCIAPCIVLNRHVKSMQSQLHPRIKSRSSNANTIMLWAIRAEV